MSRKLTTRRGAAAALLAAALLPLSPAVTPKAYAADPTAAAGTAAWLRTQTADGRLLSSAYGVTYGGSIDSFFVQVAAGAPAARVQAMANELASKSTAYTTYTDDAGVTQTISGATGKLLLAAGVAGTDPTRAGGRDLRAQALRTVQADGRVKDLGGDDYANMFSQAFVVLGLARTGDLPSKPVEWLVGLQCTGGGFTLDTTAPCSDATKADPDSTALALMALRAAKAKGVAGVDAPVASAVSWLAGKQGPDGGFGGSGPTVNANANSTGLAAAALVGTGNDTVVTKAQQYVSSLRVTSGPSAGAIAYNAEALSDIGGPGGTVTATARDQFVRATAQGALALNPVGFDTLAAPALDAGAYVPAKPFRILDTRTTSAVPGQTGVALQVAGVGGLPANIGSVVLNVTVTDPQAAGYLTAYPAGTSRPTASNVNFVAGQTIPNLVTVKVGSNGQVTLFNGAPGRTQVVADVVGYTTGGSATVAGMTQTASPVRLLDSRESGVVPANSTRELQVTGRSNIPAGATAAVLNLTVTEPGAPGYLTAYAAGGSSAGTSVLNFVTGETRANLVVAPLSASGAVTLGNTSPAPSQVVADVVGYIVGGQAARSGAYVVETPSRVLDDVTANRPLTTARTVTVSTTSAVGSRYGAVMTNATAARPAAAGYLALERESSGARTLVYDTTSTVNFVAGVPSSNAALVETSEAGNVQVVGASPAPVYALLDRFGGYIA